MNRRTFLSSVLAPSALAACTPSVFAATSSSGRPQVAGKGSDAGAAFGTGGESSALSKRMTELLGTQDGLGDYFRRSSYLRGVRDPKAIDLTFGNPHEMPLPGFVEALQKHVVPQNKEWYAYKRNGREPRRVVAASLRARTGRVFEEEDIFLTNGATAALAMAILAVTDPGDEVIYIKPPWFGYESLIIGAGARPVSVRVQLGDFDLDLDAVRAAITARTRAVIVNTPHNPTGKVFSRAVLERLAALLRESGHRFGRPIFLISDEAYCNVVFDGGECPSPTSCYERSFLVYTYGKKLLTPGQRLGYLALPPDMPQRDSMRSAMISAQAVIGWCYPSALMQHALGDLERLTIDVEQLQERRDFVCEALTRLGYRVRKPQGTFYVLVESPIADDFAYSERVAKNKVFVFPGETVGAPGFFRITLTATDEMLERSMPAFEAAIRGI